MVKKRMMFDANSHESGEAEVVGEGRGAARGRRGAAREGCFFLFLSIFLGSQAK